MRARVRRVRRRLTINPSIPSRSAGSGRLLAPRVPSIFRFGDVRGLCAIGGRTRRTRCRGRPPSRGIRRVRPRRVSRPSTRNPWSPVTDSPRRSGRRNVHRRPGRSSPSRTPWAAPAMKASSDCLNLIKTVRIDARARRDAWGGSRTRVAGLEGRRPTVRLPTRRKGRTALRLIAFWLGS